MVQGDLLSLHQLGLARLTVQCARFRSDAKIASIATVLNDSPRALACYRQSNQIRPTFMPASAELPIKLTMIGQRSVRMPCPACPEIVRRLAVPHLAISWKLAMIENAQS